MAPLCVGSGRPAVRAGCIGRAPAPLAMVYSDAASESLSLVSGLNPYGGPGPARPELTRQSLAAAASAYHAVVRIGSGGRVRLPCPEAGLLAGAPEPAGGAGRARWQTSSQMRSSSLLPLLCWLRVLAPPGVDMCILCTIYFAGEVGDVGPLAIFFSCNTRSP